jgi:hypothetical protein
MIIPNSCGPFETRFSRFQHPQFVLRGWTQMRWRRALRMGEGGAVTGVGVPKTLRRWGTAMLEQELSLEP